MNDRPDRDDKQQSGPAPWERRDKEQPEGGIRDKLSRGPSEYEGTEEHQASHLADNQQSLHSKLSGGGRDQGEAADASETKMCPACGAVTTFIQGVCTNCKYKEGSDVEDTTPAFAGPAYTPAAGGGGMNKVLIWVLVVIILVAVGYFVWQFLAADNDTANDQPAVADTGSSHVGQLNELDIESDSFHSSIESALKGANDAMANAGIDCYAYRYSVSDNVEAGQSQTIWLSVYLGGADAELYTTPPEADSFKSGMGSYPQQVNDRAGVDMSVNLFATDGEEIPAPDDKYIRYGYYFGKEHMGDIQPAIDFLEQVKDAEGRYPLTLSKVVGKTKGNLLFVSEGLGYIPLFKTDSNGNIIMGSGSGLESYMPADTTGYILMLFTRSESIGLDLYSPADFNYYRDFISPFPYQPQGKLTNMPLNRDGEPDGIAAVVHSGELVKDIAELTETY